jgi:hypothetical protein
MECNAEAHINIEEAFVSPLRMVQPSHCGTRGVDYDLCVLPNVYSENEIHNPNLLL